jgi:hypothetical protein
MKLIGLGISKRMPEIDSVIKPFIVKACGVIKALYSVVKHLQEK